MNWAAIVANLAGTPDQHVADCHAYVLAENRILRRRINRALRFTDSERIALATAANALGRSALKEVATLVTPDTLLRWHRRLVENKTPATRARVGRPPTEEEIVELVLKCARENVSWGYDRIAGALAELGHTISDTTVGNILRKDAHRDGKFAESFRAILRSAGVEPLRLPPRTPNLNAFAERFVRSIKEECLDHLILFGEASLQRACDQFVEHYHQERPHQGKDNVILFPVNTTSDPPRAGPVHCNRRLGGLLKFYYRKAG
jgi:transposase InsO family protein